MLDPKMALLSLLMAASLAVGGAVPGPGSEVYVSASTQEQGPEDWLVLDGYVVIEYEGGSLQADHVQYNQKTGDVIAEGNVMVESGGTVVTGSRMEFNIIGKKGIIHDAVGWSEGDIHFTGVTVEKIGEDVYRMTQGRMTSCQQPLPIWNISWSKAVLHQGETAQMWNTVVRFKKAPSAYAPYVVFPVKDERTTGFLMPHVSYSKTRNFSATIGYFWAISRSMDLFVEAELSGQQLSVSPEFRYVLSDTAEGQLSASWTRFEDEGTTRRELEGFFDHNQTFKSGYRWVVDLNYTSSVQFTRVNSSNINTSTIEQILSSTYLSKSFGPFSLTYRAEDRRWPDRDEYLRRIPEIEIVQRSTKLGKSPIYFGMRSLGSVLSARQDYSVPGTGQRFEDDPTYARLDLRPEFRIPFSTLPWLDVQPVLSLQATAWSAQLDEDEPLIESEPLVRMLGTFRMSVTGPKIERFYGLARPAGTLKYQQLIEPSISWLYSPDPPADVDRIIPFDAVDRTPRTPNPDDPTRDIDTNRIDFGITTRLHAKRIPFPGQEEEGSREIFSWRLGSSYLVNTFRRATIDGEEERTRFGNLFSDIRWRPTPKIDFTMRNTFDMLAKGVTSYNLVGSVNWGPDVALLGTERCATRYCMRFNYARNLNSSLDVTSESMNMYGEWRLYNDRIRLTTDLRYDLHRAEVTTQNYVFHHQSQCLGTRLEYFWNRFGERRFDVTISLKNVGDFLNFRSGGI